MKPQALIFSVILLFVSSFMLAQRIGNQLFTIALNALPTEPLPAEYTTYSTSVKPIGDDVKSAGYSLTTLPAEYFKLQSFHKLDSGGHFHIHVEVGQLYIQGMETITKEGSRKNDKGEVIKTKSYYREISYTMPISLLVVDYQGKVAMEKSYAKSTKTSKYHFKNVVGNKISNFTSQKAAIDAWNARKNAVLSKLRKNMIKGAFEAFSEELKAKIDTSPSKDKGNWRVPKGKKLEGAAEFEANAVQAKEIFAQITSEKIEEATNQQMQTVLAFWENQTNNFSPTDKKERKIYLACARNLTLAYFYLEDFDNAAKWLEACKSVDAKAGDTAYLEKLINSAKELMANNDKSTRHFVVDKGSDQGPATANYQRYYYKPTPATIIKPAKPIIEKVAGYVLTQSGDSLEGQFVFTGHNAALKPAFNAAGNVKFQYKDTKGREINRLLSPSWFQKITFNGRTFKSFAYRDGLSVKKNAHILEVIEEGQNVNLYREYGFNPKALEPNYGASLVIQLPDEDYYPMGIESIKFVDWKKAFAKFFINCDVLYAEIRVGEYKRNYKDIKRAVRVFNQNDCQ